jgi:hypothetical protein
VKRRAEAAHEEAERGAEEGPRARRSTRSAVGQAAATGSDVADTVPPVDPSLGPYWVVSARARSRAPAADAAGRVVLLAQLRASHATEDLLASSAVQLLRRAGCLAIAHVGSAASSCTELWLCGAAFWRAAGADHYLVFPAAGHQKEDNALADLLAALQKQGAWLPRAHAARCTDACAALMQAR